MITENVLNPDGEIVPSKRFDGNYENQYFFYHYDLRGSVTNIVAAEAKRSRTGFNRLGANRPRVILGT
ncbi:hypothetical protein FZD05_17975 [Rossellomorea aquimaris]|nr:hypothetical protein FZD05_17975 [Rossellomorea aquimaris]